MKTLGEVLTATASFLKDKSYPRSRRAAEELISRVLQIKRMDLYMQFDRPLLESELEAMRGQLRRAGAGEPMEYITGEVEFYHCSIEVTPAVLIPRPETEILVDYSCRRLKNETGKIAWDICTGSGCIGIAVKKACPGLSMTLSDISHEALEVARRNAQKNEVEIELLQGDLLAPFAGKKADIVFCNPPYVTSKEFLNLDRSVRDYEPKGALVGGEDGLAFYQRLEKDLPHHLNPRASIYLEIGTEQGNALLDLFSGPMWKGVCVEKDWSGHDRFFYLEFE
jgi:release factor glutamine methyltransferase